jgi:hypothetical protein
MNYFDELKENMAKLHELKCEQMRDEILSLKASIGLLHGDLQPLQEYFKSANKQGMDEGLRRDLIGAIDRKSGGEGLKIGFSYGKAGNPKLRKRNGENKNLLAYSIFERAGGFKKAGYENGVRIGRKAALAKAAQATGLQEDTLRKSIKIWQRIEGYPDMKVAVLASVDEQFKDQFGIQF